jgi:hypothetical protein
MRDVIVRNGIRILAVLAAIGIPATAHAQMRGGDRESGLPMPQDIRPMGVQMGMYGGMPPAHFEADQCGQQGCIIVINKSPVYDVAQLYINDGKRDAVGETDWGANQFQGFSLHSNKAVWTPRPRKMNCALSVRVVLRHRETNAEVEGVQPFDLCTMPKRGFAVLEIQFQDPNAPGRVILEDSPAS